MRGCGDVAADSRSLSLSFPMSRFNPSLAICRFESSPRRGALPGEAGRGIGGAAVRGGAQHQAALRLVPEAQLAEPRRGALHVQRQRLHRGQGRGQGSHRGQRGPGQPGPQRQPVAAEGRRHRPLLLRVHGGEPVLRGPQVARQDRVLSARRRRHRWRRQRW